MTRLPKNENGGNIHPLNPYNGYLHIIGNNHTIKGLRINGYYEHCGFVGHAHGIEIRDITFDDAQIFCESSGTDIPKYCGIVVGHNHDAIPSDFLNITIKNGKIGGQAECIGGLIGHSGILSAMNIINCHSNVDISIREGNEQNYINEIGGVAGCLEAGAIQNTSYDGNINCSEYTNTKFSLRVGGIIGHLTNNNSLHICASNSNIQINPNTEGDIGGIAGYSNSGTISHSYFNGSIQAENAMSGGIVGNAQPITLIFSYSTGSITGNNAGSIAGYLSDNNRRDNLDFVYSDIHGIPLFADGKIAIHDKKYFNYLGSLKDIYNSFVCDEAIKMCSYAKDTWIYNQKNNTLTLSCEK